MMRLQNFLKMFCQDVLKMSWRRVDKANIFVLTKTSLKEVWLIRIYSFPSRRLEDVLKTSFEDDDKRIFKTSWRCLHQDEVCWADGSYFSQTFKNTLSLSLKLETVTENHPLQIYINRTKYRKRWITSSKLWKCWQCFYR